jgi:5-(aminomethyl)-3-furanmethanol phosphate kinase
VTTAGKPLNGLTVIKVGGGLLAVAGALESVCAAVGRAAREQSIVVVPGGGPFAQAVRQFEREVELSPSASHWMAHLAMDQYAEVLAERVVGGVVVAEPGGISAALNSGLIPVVAPSRWMRAADVLPHSWEVTSDSIAAFIAGALDATRLILIKPGSNMAEPLDPYFPRALPTGLPYTVIGCDQLDHLSNGLPG